MMMHIWQIHWITASLLPEIVTALSVEFGSISLATWIDAPVTSLISLIFDPPFPMREPHWDAGTTNRKVIGGRGTVSGDIRLLRSCKQTAITFHYQIITANSYLFEFIAYECKGLENVFRVASDCDNSLRTASIADIYFRPTL